MENEEIIFGRFRLDLGRRELRRDGQPVGIHRLALGILCALAEAKGEIVSKDALMARLWPGRIVEEGNLHVHVSALRKFFDERGEGHSLVVTVPGRGYRLADLTGLRSAALAQGAVRPQLPLPDKPSIAVLPFQNMSGDPEQEYFAEGMVEDIITALSRIRWLFVIARNSSFTYKGKTVDVKQVGRELGVRYVLEGSVRRATGRVRITAQLIEAGTGAHLWAERFDGSLENVFDLQEEVATSIAGVIEPTLGAAETARSGARPTTDLTAYDLYLRAHAMVMSSTRHMSGALRLMEQAIAGDPHYGPALAWAAFCCFRMILDGQSDDATADRRKGIDFARRALEVAAEDAGTLANAAFALAYFGEDIGAMIAIVDRALALNPSFARGWHISGVMRIWAGQLDLGVERVAASLRLSPRTRVADWAFVTGYARFAGRCFEEAVANLLLAIQQDPKYPHPYRVLAACYAHMGRLDDAHETIVRLAAIAPVMADDAHYLRNPEHRELLLSGLRLATRAKRTSGDDPGK
jgi:adenylate cyclase